MNKLSIYVKKLAKEKINSKKIQEKIKKSRD